MTETTQTLYVCDDPGVKQLNGVLMLTAVLEEFLRKED